MFCNQCGQPLPESARYCGFCGADLTSVFPDRPEPAASASKANLPPRREVRPIQQPAAAPYAPMNRAYRLTTLHSAVVYGVLQEVVAVGLSLFTSIALSGWLLRNLGSGEGLQGLQRLGDLISGDGFQLTQQIVMFVFYFGGLLLGLVIARTLRRRLPAAPPEERPLSAGGFLLVALVTYAFWMGGVLLGNAPGFFAPAQESPTGWINLPSWLLAVVIAPIFEELVFRKIVLDRVRPYGEGIAVLTSALLFGVAHQNAAQFFLAFFVGLVFAKVYLRTGKIVYTMLLHFMINMTATLDEVGCLIWGNRFDTWFMLIAAGVALIGLVLFLLLRKKHPILLPCAKAQPEAANAALRCWPVTLVKIIGIVSIAGYGLLFAFFSLFHDVIYQGASLDPQDPGGILANLNPLGLLYLLPAAGAIALILALTRRRVSN